MSPGVNATKPPSKHAMGCLRAAVRKPYPAQEINFTVRDKLIQFGYAALVKGPSPYKTHKAGTMIDFITATDLGREAASELE